MSIAVVSILIAIGLAPLFVSGGAGLDFRARQLEYRMRARH
ncbi:hypothetical protein ACH47B_12815 [Rhodococcus sp. NPDC019627]|jgi:hypothetical protein|nr:MULTISPECIES: hypothetical protein [Rhodococcus]MDV7355774.1 hypothetical protein [Rhodococcus oxybenzonivorans]QHE71530.1 hypothetical protein GFS60_05139 [Rhodococcus sp. WAY2]